MEPDSAAPGRWGPVLFLLILILVAAIAVVAFSRTGSISIEDRYRQAVGLPAGNPEEATFGISVEGDPVLYGIVVIALLAAGFAAYRYLPRKETETGPEKCSGETGKIQRR
jgi:hypothetical protein